MPQYFAYIHLDQNADAALEERVTDLLRERYFYKRIRPEAELDRPRTLPLWLYEGDSDEDIHTVAHTLRDLIREEFGGTPYVLTMHAHEFGLSFSAGAYIGIEDLDPDRN